MRGCLGAKSDQAVRVRGPMPQSLTIGIFVLGAVMLLLALVSGGFKIFGSEIPGVASRWGRIIAFFLGVVLVGFSLFHFQEGPVAKGADHGSPPLLDPAKAQAANTGANPPPAEDRPPPKP